MSPHAVLTSQAEPCIDNVTGAVTLPISMPPEHTCDDDRLALVMTAGEADRLMWQLASVLRVARDTRSREVRRCTAG